MIATDWAKLIEQAVEDCCCRYSGKNLAQLMEIYTAWSWWLADEQDDLCAYRAVHWLIDNKKYPVTMAPDNKWFWWNGGGSCLSIHSLLPHKVFFRLHNFSKTCQLFTGRFYDTAYQAIWDVVEARRKL